MPQIHKFRNGLTLVVENMPYASTISCFIDVKVGAICDTKPGLSHLVEHLIFGGTKHKTGIDIRKEFDQISTIVNASTSVYHTRFYVKNATKYFRQSFALLAHIISHSTFDSKVIAKEKKVIYDEILYSQDSLSTTVLESACQAFFSHANINTNILGTKQSLESITRRDILRHYKRYYTASNITISFAGAINIQQAKNLVTKHFFVGLNNTCNQYKFSGGIIKPQPKEVRINKLSNQAKIELLIPAYNSASKFSPLQDVIVGVLNGSGGRLFKHLRDELGLVYNVGAYFMDFHNTGIIGISLATSYQNINLALDAVCKVLQQLKTHGITKQELNTQITKQQIYMITSNEQTISMAGSNGMDMSKYGYIKSFEQTLQTMQNIQVSQVNQLIRDIITSKHATIAVLEGNQTQLKPIVF